MYAASQCPDIYKECLMLQAEFDVLMIHCSTEPLLETRSKFFEHSDKASKLLVHQICQASSSHQIPQIQTSLGVTTNPLEINMVCKEFYMSLDVHSIEQDVDEKLKEPVTTEEQVYADIPTKWEEPKARWLSI